MSASRAAAPAVRHARDFLLSALAEDRCLDTWYANVGVPPVRNSCSVFLMYFLARALVASGGLDARATATVRGHVERARKRVGYGYEAHGPPDADDTAFALRARLLLGEELARVEIDRCLAPFRYGASWLTFAAPGLTPRVDPWTIEHRDDSSTVGVHPEVHLNVLSLLREAGFDREDRSVGREERHVPLRDGLPACYHYPSGLYAAWLFGELQRGRSDTSALDLAITTQQRDDGAWAAVANGFSAPQETALAILALSDEQVRSTTGQRATRVLLAAQRHDGSWPGGVLWTFHVPETEGRVRWWAEDSESILATSLAVAALQRDPDALAGSR